MIKEITMYIAVCDNCGGVHESDEFAGFGSGEQAEIFALEDGFRLIDGAIYCDKCWIYNEQGKVQLKIT